MVFSLDETAASSARRHCNPVTRAEGQGFGVSTGYGQVEQAVSGPMRMRVMDFMFGRHRASLAVTESASP
jgi:hypothetical protein